VKDGVELAKYLIVDYGLPIAVFVAFSMLAGPRIAASIMKIVEKRYDERLKEAHESFKSELRQNEANHALSLKQAEASHAVSLKQAEASYASSLSIAAASHASLLKDAEASHASSLKHVESTHDAMLRQAEVSYKSALDIASAVDSDLRTKRELAYATVWKKTRILPNWPWDQTVTYDQIQTFSTELRDWYYDGGGMYFSSETMTAYRALQDTIWNILEPKVKKDGSLPQESIIDHYGEIREKCSLLRTRMTEDLVSRRSMMVPAPIATGRGQNGSQSATEVVVS
jgi:hypothetical protein